MARQKTSFADLPKVRPAVAALLAAAKDEAADDTPRLALADWLQENGDENDAARAEFIRLQCEIARTADAPAFPPGSRLSELARREGELKKEHANRWLGPLRERIGTCQFHRGLLWPAFHSRHFLSGVTTAVAASEIGHWVEYLDLRLLKGDARRIARCPLLAHVRRLNLRYSYNLGNESVATLLASPHVANLRSLDLSHVHLQEGGAEGIVGSGAPRHLTELSLEGNRLGPADAAMLAAAPHLGGLTSLNLRSNHIGAEGVRALVASLHLVHLAALHLGNNAIGPEGLAALTSAPGLGALTALDLSGNAIRSEELQVLLAWPGLERITSLSLFGNSLGDSGVAALAASPRLANLATLDLSNNALGLAAAEALASSPHLGRLKTLLMSYNGIGLQGAMTLASSSRLVGLTTFQAWSNGIDEQGQKLLRERFGERFGTRLSV
jgi:uncharacterized protein (TIGR02996 family)